MRILLNPSDPADYRLFLRVKSLPRYRIAGAFAEFPDEYAAALGVAPSALSSGDYYPRPGLFDYQRDIARLAVAKRKFACFADCGLGKTLIFLEFARHALAALAGTPRPQVLIVSPLMVVRQTVAECARWYGESLPLEVVPAAGLRCWLSGGVRRPLGLTNYEAIGEGLSPGRLGGLVLDESSMLKSHYGAWGRRLIGLGRGLSWKLCCTGTPAPNDRIEYANHAVFLDQFPTVNAFLARFFVNRGQTDNRWELKPHALRPFYRSLSHWCVFLSDPGAYGWRDNAGGLPPIHVHVEDVSLTALQRSLAGAASGDLFGIPGGIGSRSTLARIAKGCGGAASLKPAYVRDRVASWPDESTLVWCLYNAEQEHLAGLMPEAGNISGATPHEERVRLIEEFQAGRLRVLVSKPKILGFGLNLQIVTRQVFSGLQDSYEQFYQAVKRSNRIGSTRPLNVHVPVTDLERPMVETVLRKARMVEADTREQEKMFREAASL
jgi:hypothetical protein